MKKKKPAVKTTIESIDKKIAMLLDTHSKVVKQRTYDAAGFQELQDAKAILVDRILVNVLNKYIDDKVVINNNPPKKKTFKNQYKELTDHWQKLSLKKEKK